MGMSFRFKQNNTNGTRPKSGLGNGITPRSRTAYKYSIDERELYGHVKFLICNRVIAHETRVVLSRRKIKIATKRLDKTCIFAHF